MGLALWLFVLTVNLAPWTRVPKLPPLPAAFQQMGLLWDAFHSSPASSSSTPLPLFPPDPSPAFPPHPAVSISAVIFSTSCRKRAISGSSVSNTRPTQTDLMEIYRRKAMQLWGAFLKSFSVPVLRMEFIYLMFSVAATLSTASVTYPTFFFFFFTRIPVKSCYTAHFWSNSSQLLTLPS